jgi:integrase
MEQPVTVKYAEYGKIRSDMRESSVEVLNRAVRWFTELFGDLDVSLVTYSHIDDYKKWLSNGRSRSAANCYLGMLKSFFGWLARRRYIVSNPFEGITLFKVTSKKFEIYTPDEIKRIYAVSDDLWKLIISLALCGMREAEILNLVVKDIDFENNRIKITPKKDTAETWRWDIKNYQEAYIGLDESITKLLIARCEKLEEMPYVNLKEKYWRRNIKKRDAGCLRQRQRNNPWGNFNRDFKSLLRRAMVEPKRFHDLRGTFATERYKKGYGLKELQYLLRHSSIQTTAIYIRDIDEQRLVARSGEVFAEHYATFLDP